MSSEKSFQIIRAAIDNALLRKELQEGVEEGWLTEEQANAIRQLKVPSGDRRRQLKTQKAKMAAQASQSAERARKVMDLVTRPKSWKGLESYEPQPPQR